jgi:hypothetical protein
MKTVSRPPSDPQVPQQRHVTCDIASPPAKEIPLGRLVCEFPLATAYVVEGLPDLCVDFVVEALVNGNRHRASVLVKDFISVHVGLRRAVRK